MIRHKKVKTKNINNNNKITSFFTSTSDRVKHTTNTSNVKFIIEEAVIKETMSLSQTQQLCFKKYKQKQNIFLTGQAGTGKTI